jgi:hypothetical protein
MDIGSHALPAVTPAQRRTALVVLALVVAGLAAAGVLLDRLTTNSARPGVLEARRTAAERAPGVLDGFRRADDDRSLGRAVTGEPWAARAGVWGITSDTAYVVRPAPRGSSLALVEGGTADGIVTVRAARMAQGFGLAFRCRGPSDCWTISAVPSVGTWNVTRTVAGRSVLVGNVGTAPVATGTIVEVRMAGPTLTFAFDGQVLRTIEDAALARATGAGLFLANGGDNARARWDRFLVRMPAPSASSTTIGSGP